MRVRLQVLVSESEMDEIRQVARLEGLSVADWVRGTLRETRQGHAVHETERKLKAVRKAAGYSFPTDEMDQMLDEIERGYRR